MAKTKKPTKLKLNKLALWLKAYTNETNPNTFLNKTASAKYAGYKCRSENSFGVVGYQNFKKLQPEVAKWLEDNKFSLPALRLKHSELLECRKTSFHKVKGRVSADDLAPGVHIIAESTKMTVSGHGEAAEEVDDGETLLAIDVAEPEIQRKALDMAYKVTGGYAPERRELGGIGGGAIPLTAFPPEPKTIEEWEKNRKIAEDKRIAEATG